MLLKGQWVQFYSGFKAFGGGLQGSTFLARTVASNKSELQGGEPLHIECMHGPTACHAALHARTHITKERMLLGTCRAPQFTKTTPRTMYLTLFCTGMTMYLTHTHTHNVE